MGHRLDDSRPIMCGASGCFQIHHLFGKNANVLMGWELKMPDTPIEDQEFYENAKKKANLLGTNSFLLWNGKSAKLYGRKNDAFHELKSWNESRLVDRKTMGLHPDYWIELLKLIINDLEFYFHSGRYQLPSSLLCWMRTSSWKSLTLFMSRIQKS